MVIRRMLIDTSMWTCVIRRKGHEVERERVGNVIKSGYAVWCDPVRLELWQGVSGDTERLLLNELEQNIDLLPTTHETWIMACQLAGAGRKKGLQFPYADMLIFSCAKLNHVDLLHRDSHFDALAELYQQLR